MQLPEEFQELLPQEQEVLQQYLEPISFAKDQLIFKAGDVGDSAFILDEGDVRLEFDREELDSEKVVAILKPGEILGELALLDHKPRSLSAFAETDTRCRIISNNSLKQLYEHNPLIAAKIYLSLGRSIAEKLRITNEKMADSLIMSSGRMKDVDEMVAKGKAASKAFCSWDEKCIDDLLYKVCQPIIANAAELAEDAVNETHLGNVHDKISKHTNACLGIYENLVGKKGAGITSKKHLSKMMEISDAMGVIFGMVPVTNPVSTTCFKAMIAIKSRNAIILSPNRVGSKVVTKAVDMVRKVLLENGAPEDLVQVVRERQSRQVTSAFMHHKDISLILATGGAAMVKAAYSSGTPAIGVGPGNTPCMIASDADIPHAAKSIIKSKSFDNGMICGSEHNLVAVCSITPEFISELEKNGAAVLSKDETKLFMEKAITSSGAFGRKIIGQDAIKIAEYLGIMRSYPIKLIVVPSEGIDLTNHMVHEKTAPILSLFIVDTDEDGIKACEDILDIEGAGHTAIIHTKNNKLAEKFGLRIKASRILVNSPGVQGIIGLCTGLPPSFTLGCGSFGGNSTTDNVSYKHLLNVKHMAWFLPYKKLDVLLEKLHGMAPHILYMIKIWGLVKQRLPL